MSTLLSLSLLLLSLLFFPMAFLLNSFSLTTSAIELKLEETMSLVASVPDELVDSGRSDWVVLVLVHSDRELVVVLIESTDDSRYESIGGPRFTLLLLKDDVTCSWPEDDCSFLALALLFLAAAGRPLVVEAAGTLLLAVDGLLLEA